MTSPLLRRDFLKASAVIAGAATHGFTCVEIANAAPITVPTIDKLSIRILSNCSRSPSGSSISGCRLRGELR